MCVSREKERGLGVGRRARDTEGLAPIPNSDQYHPTLCTSTVHFYCALGTVHLALCTWHTVHLAPIPNSDQYQPTAHCSLVLLYKVCTRAPVQLQGILCIFLVELCDTSVWAVSCAVLYYSALPVLAPVLPGPDQYLLAGRGG